MNINNFVSRSLSAALLICVSHSSFANPILETQPVLIRYKIQTQLRDPFEVGTLSRWLTEQNFDVAGLNWKDGEIEVITDQSGIDYLISIGLSGFAKQSLSKEQSPDSRYYNPTSLNQKIHALADAYPNLTRIEQIGTTIQGRPILALLLSDTPDANDPKNVDKASIIFDSEHHAREVMTPEIVIDVANTLLTGYGTSDQIKALFQHWNFWLVPMVNPDGSNIVFTSDNMWRKNAHGNANNPYGVDINRNYNYKWSGCRGSSSSTYAQDYHGTAAASEPETQAIMKLAQAVRPSAYLSYHSYSELVLYPYGCGNSLTAEDKMFGKIAAELAALLPSDSGGGNYEAGTPWQLIYATDGDSMSYMYATYGALAFTFEVNQDFQPNYSVRNPTVAKHRGAWMHFLTRIDQNLLKVVVTDASSGQAAPATIAVDVIPHTQGELPFQTNTGGRFFKTLDPGHYVISAKLADGRTGQVAVDMTGAPQTATITIN